MTHKMTAAILLVPFFFISTVYSMEPTDAGFIVHLYRTGEYQSVILEINRYLYYNPDSRFTPYARYLLGLSYAKAGRMRRALTVLEELRKQFDKNVIRSGYSGLYSEAYVQEMNIYFREKDRQNFWTWYHGIDSMVEKPPEELMMYIESMGGALFIYNLEWEKALDLLKSSEHLGDIDTAYIETSLETLDAGKRKSVLLGGLFSVVPGVGHFYAGRRSDGLRSLLINGTFIALTVVSIVAGAGVPAVLFGVVEAVLYVSNIYGGINAVMQENARRTLAQRDELLRMLPVPPLDPITVIEELKPR